MLDDAAGIARVHVDTWRTAYRGLIPDDVLAGFSYLAANDPARRFYEVLGGRLLREKQADIFGLTLPEVSYGWTDLDDLIRRAGG